MKVFISWSGNRSKAVAEMLCDWLPNVLQAIEPWMSKDIDRGAIWFNEISDKLADVSIGIICLTHENQNKPWILFEAGALAKGLSKNRVCPLLIDLNTDDVENPLAQFNLTLPSHETMLGLIGTINNKLESHALPPSRLESAFNTYWPQFEDKLKQILKKEPSITPKEQRPQKEILSDILNTVRTIDKRLSPSRNIAMRSQHANSNALIDAIEFLEGKDQSPTAAESLLKFSRLIKKLDDINKSSKHEAELDGL